MKVFADSLGFLFLLVCLFMLASLSGCAAQVLQDNPEAKAIQLIHSRAGSMSGIFQGKTDSCSLLTTEDLEIKTIAFDEAGTVCKVTLKADQ